MKKNINICIMIRKENIEKKTDQQAVQLAVQRPAQLRNSNELLTGTSQKLTGTSQKSDWNFLKMEPSENTVFFASCTQALSAA